MRSTLFHIPHADPLWEIPLFGFGWMLLLVALAGLLSLAYRIYHGGWRREALADVPLLLILALVAWMAPWLEQPTATGPPLGIPIRAYGVMVLLGICAGIFLTVRQAQRMGVDPETIVSLCFWMIVAGFIGARIFYVVEYWELFARPTPGETLVQIARLTDGGLVVYGSFIGAVLACVAYSAFHKLPLLALADLLAPGLMIGLALGRLGCLLNGCCWGSVCDHSPLGITFPQGSPPYMSQLEHGWLVGMDLRQDATGDRLVVHEITPGGEAERQGVRAGDAVAAIRFPDSEQFDRMRRGQAVPQARVSFQLEDGRHINWPFEQLPARSQPVYPSQILSSITAALICFFLWSYYPFRRRDGEVFALLITIYPVARILEEIIRSDEPSILSTSFRWTISQTVSGLLLLLVVLLWWFILSRPTGSALPAPIPTNQDPAGKTSEH